MFCWKCGESNPDTSLFCYKCGVDLTRGQSYKKPTPTPAHGLPQQPNPITPQPSQHSPFLGAPHVPGQVSHVVTQSIQAPTGMIGNRYKIDRELGRGGRGVVFKAFDTQLEIDVAIKFLPPELAADQAAVEEMKLEAKAAIMLSHPNIVRLHNFEDIGGYKFLTMEFIDGPTLDEMLMRRKQFTVSEAILYATQILEGLEYAHKKGVIHRDIKPSNLMKTPEGIIKITDYGIASIISDSIKKISSEFVIGTPRYMSPEQLLGKPLDNRSDLYSLGVVLYEFLNGKPPFTSGGLEYQIINNIPEPIINVPEKINYVILKSLEKNPDDRWDNAKQFSDALEGKLKIILPSETPKRESLSSKMISGIENVADNIKSSIRDSQQKKRREILKRRTEFYQKKQKTPGIRESEIFRHSIIGIWTIIFTLLFPFKINVSGANEIFLLAAIFAQAVIFGILSYWKWLSFFASFLLVPLGYFISFANQPTLLKSKSLTEVLCIAFLTGVVGWIITYMRVNRDYSLKKLWEFRDYPFFWFVVTGGLYIIPILEEHTQMGRTHISIFLYMLFISLLVNKFYNTFIFPFITLTLYTYSILGFNKLLNIIVSPTEEVTLVDEIIQIGSFKTLIWELTVITGLLSFILSIIGIILREFNTVLYIITRTIMTVILLVLCIYAYHAWISKDVYVGSKVYVKPNEVAMGISEEKAIKLANAYNWELDKFVPEYPENKVFVNSFYIDRFEVTNRQYRDFIHATNYQAPEHWSNGDYQFLEDFNPIVGISFEDAKKYAEWRGGRIPTEAEWMLAASGGKDILFPWGNDLLLSTLEENILKAKTNSRETNRIGSFTVGWYYTDMSPSGCFDMGGNVMEMVSDDYQPYQGNAKSSLDLDFKKDYRLVKGGSYNLPYFNSRISARYGVPKDSRKLDVGFRVIYSVTAKEDVK